MGWRTARRLLTATAIVVTLMFWPAPAPSSIVIAEEINVDDSSASGPATDDIIFLPDAINLPDEDPEFCIQNAQLCPEAEGP